MRARAYSTLTNSKRGPWRPWQKVASIFTTGAVIVSGLALATPAAAVPIAEVPADPSTWASAPYSPLAPALLAPPVNNTRALEFNGTDAGLNAAGDIGTGFTMVQPSSGFTNTPTWALTTTRDTEYYVPANLGVAGGKLTIAATKGIAFEKQAAGSEGTVTKNRQDNTLGLGLNPNVQPIRLQTTFTNPAGIHSAAQAGVWFGADDDNFFKVVMSGHVTGADDRNRQFQIKREVAGVTNDAAANEINVKFTDGTVPVNAEVTVTLDINPTTLKAIGSYQIGTAAPVTIGTQDVPANFLTGALLTNRPAGVEAFGGIFTTKRNMAAAAPASFAFERFAVSELDTVAPAAPSALASAPTVSENVLSWSAPADADIAGYRVYRSATASPVPAVPANLVSGAALVTTSTYTDGDVFVGQAYNYSVYAVDTSGNVSAAAASVASTTPAPAGTAVQKIDFTTPAAAAQTGYTKDSGAAYSESAGFGWVAADDAAPFDFSLNSRVRPAVPNVTDPRLLSLIHMQYGMSGDQANPPNATLGIIAEQGVWQHKVPNGRYAVVVAAGEAIAGNFDSKHNLVVEGVNAIDQFQASASTPAFQQGVVEVEVTDGLLTVAPTDGDNTKIAFLEIYQLELFGPDAPANLAATLGANEESVNLTWQPVPGATGYNVFRGSASPVAVNGAPLNASPLTAGAFTDATVDPGQTYIYTVVALGAAGTPASAPATEVSISTAAEPVAPATPSGVAATAGTNNITVAWNAVTGATGYKVYRGATSAVSTAGTPLSGASAITAASFVDTTAVAGIQYFYVVVATGVENLQSAASAAVSATIQQPVQPGVCATSSWSVDYFAGRDLNGAAIASECLTSLNETIAAGESPVAGVGAENWSARYSTTIDQGAGSYTFTATADDGIRVFVDGVKIIDRWIWGSEPEVVTVPLTAGPHAISVEFYQGYGGAQIKLGVKMAVNVCDTAGWAVDYFDGRLLEGGAVASDCIDELDETFAAGDSPAAGVEPYNWSARYTKTINDGAGSYTFTATADDGIRVFVDGVAVINRWAYGSDAETVTVPLTAGDHQVIVEFFQGYGGASVALDYRVAVNSCEASEWSAVYFDGRSLAGNSVASECLPQLDETFAAGTAPATGVGSENWSARYSKSINEGAGNYTFTASADDGIRVLVDGEPVIDRWSYGSDPIVVTVPLTAGEHALTVEFFQGYGGANVSVDYSVSVNACEASDWSVNYFGGRDLMGAPLASECLTEVDQQFAAGVAPAAGVSAENWSARYSKKINEGAGSYTFTASADDGIRVFVDGTAVIDRWFYGSEPIVVTVPLSAAEHVVTVEFFQGYGGADVDVTYERQGADTAPPTAPTQVTATASAFSIAVGWAASASSDVVGYNVYRGTAAGVTATAAQKRNTALLTAGPWNDSPVTPNVNYFYVVTAVDGAGNESVVSNEAQAVYSTAPDTEAPAAPTALVATGADTSVNLSWAASASTDTIGYEVYRAIQPGAVALGTLVSGAAPIAGTTFVDTTVTNGTTYFYVVLAVDLAKNKSSDSEEAVVVPRVPNTTNVKVDFTATNAVPVTGYVADWGQAYGTRSGANQGSGLSYGWIDEDGGALSLVSNGRDRGRAGVPELVDSFLHMQYGDAENGNGTNGIKTSGAWEVAVPDGLYEVTVAVGDQPGANNVYDSQHVLNIEGSLGIELFQATTANEFATVTTKVGVWDGRLTIDAVGGKNTKIGYVNVVGIPFDAPHVDTVLPDNRATEHGVNSGVSSTIKVPFAGVGVKSSTLTSENVKLIRVADGVQVESTSGTSGGNDVITLNPTQPLTPNTQYRFVVTSGVLDNFDEPFVPFSSVFTTGSGTTGPGTGGFKPLTNIAFEKVEIQLARDRFWASFTFGPDGKLYASTIGQGLWRYTVNPDGTLANEENLGYPGIAMVGLLFDKSSTAGNLKLWVTNTTANTGNEGDEWASGISMLTGPNLADRKSVFTKMPRSLRDHLTNSMVYGPNDDIYVLQGSNTAAGDGDNSWGARGEKLLTAALLNFDPDNARIQQAVADPEGDNPLNVKTEVAADQAVAYNPYATNAPLQIYATGIRNAYDLVYHSNGHLYVPTNGTAGGGNSAGVTYNAATNSYAQVSAPGIPGFAQSNGRNLTDACRARDARDPNYVPGNVPAVGNHPTQRDTLYDIVKGGYYGHPNPMRCEFVLHEGNDPAKPPMFAGQGGSKYAVGVMPDVNYKGVAYDFEYNKSPNGAIEYKSNTFGGQLKGNMVVVRFSNNNDLIFIQTDPATGEVLGAQTEVGLTGVPNTTMQGVGGFNDPLEVIEDTRNGNMYVNQYNLGGNQQKLWLLRVPASQQAAKITSSVDELVYSAVKSNGTATAAQKTDVNSITITNNTTQQQAVTTAINGANASEFSIVGTVPATLAAGASATFQVRFTPGTTIGQRAAQLVLKGGDSTVNVGLFGLTMNGIEGGNEPVLNDVVKTLGYNINVGWTNLAGGMTPAAKGDEILEPLFVKSGTGSVTWKPLAHYAPPENIPFGWYTGDGTAADRRAVGGINGTNTATGGYQTLLPPFTANSTPTFDPGSETFGFYYRSDTFNRYGFTEDRLNTPAASAHRARIYPAKNRSGVLIPNSYIVAFEDADNGDYQDYMFLVSGIKPVTETGSGGDAIKVDFTTASGDLATDYLRDYGQAFGARTGAGQGSGLTYGWKDQATENDVNLSIGGTTPGNGRDRNSAQTDMRLDSFMHMQPTDVAGTFNGTNVDAFWEIALPDGTYEVTVGVGDPNAGTDPESHVINAENAPLLTAFVPSGAAGSNTRHSISAPTRVEVTDGALTLDALTGTNTKIGFVDIVPLTVTDPGGDDPSDGAQVKFTFQPAGTPVPAGWAAETGNAFSTQRGHGWLNADTNQPVDRSVATRYRTAPLDGIAFPTDGRQQGLAFIDNASQPTYTNGKWEYVLENGTYDVAVSVGDANYLDSTHRVLAEGEPVVNGFTPTTATPFQVGVREVTVTDGRLTITNGGENTKINWISIKGEDLEPENPAFSKQIDFRPAATTAPAGWTADNGLGYDTTRGFGWLVDGAPFDRSNMTRNRAAATSGIPYPSDSKLQTLILMQNRTTTGEVITGTVGTWEYAVPAGTYTVTASVGDSSAVDSVHGISVENTPLINYTPTTAAPFGTATVTTVVSDGKLTVTPTGVNTKMSWIRIEGTPLVDPVVNLTVNGSAAAATYEGGTAIVAASAAVATGSTLQSLTYTVNGGAATPYTAPVTFATAGTYTLAFTATDSTGKVGTKSVALTVLNIGGTLTLANQQAIRQPNGQPIPGFSEDHLVMQRINNNPAVAAATAETATVNVTNTGTKDLRITSLTLGGSQPAQFALVTPPTLPLTITPGQSVPITTQFIAASGAKGVRSANLTIASSDPTQANKVIQLRGGYMGAREGGNELTLQSIFNLFGSNATTTGATGDSLGNGSEFVGSPMNGDEIRSLQWKRLDSSKPVQAVQLAAFHGCCNNTEVFSVNGANATHAGNNAQTILPKKADGTPTAISTNPTGNFSMSIAGMPTSDTSKVAVKLWPVKDAAGKVIAGSYFMGHDYVFTPESCGVGATNCDFQDNVVLVTNVLPVASSDTVAPLIPGLVSGTADATGVNLTWPASTDADLIGYRVERATTAGGAWTNIGGTGVIGGTTFRDTGAGAIATTYYRVIAVDSSGNTTPGLSSAVNTSAIVAAPIRINAGGPALTLNGVNWQADTFFSNPSITYTTGSTADVTGTTSDQLYRTERSASTDRGSFNYSIPVPTSGNYEVKLHFAEIYAGVPGAAPTAGAGYRVMSVNMEGGPVEVNNLDVFAVTGGALRAHITTNNVAVTDGTLNIVFSASVNRPKVSAIEVVRVP